jgi:hypothetical protein
VLSSSLGYWPLKVRDQAADIFGVTFVNQSRMAQFALTLGRLFGQNMTGKSFITSDFASSGFTETFGGSAVSLDLGHCFSP